MERESFEDEEVAKILNNNFISIKVDREERPDIDSIYMTYCQALTGSGGWPLTIIMTPEKKPFFAGTYFPKTTQRGMPGVMEILNNVIDLWQKERDAIVASSNDILEKLQNSYFQNEEGELTEKAIEKAYQALSRSFDKVYGGFGSAPKFPTPHNLMFLLRYYKKYNKPEALEMVEKTLESMYKGGIYDHLGFGFSRYSTDNKWLVPHFEKMLYDNALLAIIFLETYQLTKKELYAKVANEIFTYVLRDMTSDKGGFYSAEDADSEGEEGKFYIWSPEEVIDILGEEDGKVFNETYDITAQGNFEGKSIPNLIRTRTPFEGLKFKKLDNLRNKLFKHREKRVHPYKDDKILTAWNGLMLAALSMGARILKNKDYLKAAQNAAKFILENLYLDNRLYARYRGGEVKHLAYVDDYAFFIWGLIELYESSYEATYLNKAIELNDEMLEIFEDKEKGGLFLYGKDGEKLIARTKEIYDGAIPSGNSVAIHNLLRLGVLTGKDLYFSKADSIIKAFGGTVNNNPLGHTNFLSAQLFNSTPHKRVILCGSLNSPVIQEFIDITNWGFEPFLVSILISPEHLTELEKYLDIEPGYLEHKKPTVYLCENFTCHAPTSDLDKYKKFFKYN
jgi:uncharacterized protein YyaL (SSP411 family)